jgi:hypothetical protein
MSASAKLKEEIRSVGLYTLFFGAWFSMFMLMKDLVLSEYEIRFFDMSAVLVGALILAKVALLMEHVSLGAWTREKPAWVDVVVRTMLYSIGVLLVLILEKAFDVRHEQGGVLATLSRLLRHEDIYHVLANAICAGGALLTFNALSVMRRSLGAGTLRRIFLTSLQATESARRG